MWKARRWVVYMNSCLEKAKAMAIINAVASFWEILERLRKFKKWNVYNFDFLWFEKTDERLRAVGPLKISAES